jgi:dUTP pyrophosphatase
MQKIKFCFTSEKAKELYNGKPPQFETPFASGFDLRACLYSDWYEPIPQFVDITQEEVSTGRSTFAVYNTGECQPHYDNRFTINLVSKYKTRFDGDWSNGTFLQGRIVVNTEDEANKIIDTFLHESEITLYEADKYNKISKELSTVSFPSGIYYGGEVYHGEQGFGRLGLNDDCKQVYFLDVIKPKKSITLIPNARILVKTGIRISMPIVENEIMELQIRSRSGLARNNGVKVLNGIGTIDNDYTGELGVILHNAGNSNFTVNIGDRIAQGVFNPIQQCVWNEVSEEEFEKSFCNTERGSGGFGSTGK